MVRVIVCKMLERLVKTHIHIEIHWTTKELYTYHNMHTVLTYAEPHIIFLVKRILFFRPVCSNAFSPFWIVSSEFRAILYNLATDFGTSFDQSLLSPLGVLSNEGYYTMRPITISSSPHACVKIRGERKWKRQNNL